MISYSRPAARPLSLALCLIALITGFAGPRAAAAKTRLAAAKHEAGKAATPGRPQQPLRTPVAEVEPNDDMYSAMYLPGTRTRVRGDVYRAGDVDWFAFEALTGDKVFAATATSAADPYGSSDTVLTLLASDGTTVVEQDDNDGSFDKGSSSIAGASIPADGTYYLRVTEPFSGDVRSYDLYFQLRNGTPTAEAEPNDTPGDAQSLSTSGYVSGGASSDLDLDVYSIDLQAGDTIFASLDCDPERDTYEWAGVLGIAEFGNPGVPIVATGGGADSPYSNALALTVKATGTYYVFVGGQYKGDYGTYALSASVFPRADAGQCGTYASTDVPKTITDETFAAAVTSTLTVPDNPRVSHLRVDLDITHLNMSDLDAQLTAPNGATIELFSGVGSSDQTHMDLTLDDDGALALGQSDVVGGLVFAPQGQYRLDSMNGVDAGGTWTLTIHDTSSVGGTLNGWGLEICDDTTVFCDGGTKTTLLDADFESTDGGFTHAGGADEWEWGAPSAAPIADAHSGTNAWKTDLDGQYDADSSQELYSPVVTLPAVGNFQLSWAQKYQMGSAAYDHAYVDIVDVSGPRCRGCGNAVRRLWEYRGPTMRAPAGFGTLEEVAGWGTLDRDISDFAGKDVRIVWHVDSIGGAFSGLAVDDVKIESCDFGGGGGSTPSADLSVQITPSSTPIGAGGDVAYSVVIANAGPDDAGATTVTLPLPAGTTLYSATGPNGWTVTAPTVGTNGTVSFDAAGFASGGLTSFTVVASIGCDIADNTTLVATATIVGATADGSTADNTATTNVVAVNQAPYVANPSPISVNATAGLCGAVVTFATPTALDDSASCSPTVVCAPASGSTFAVGVTTVTCTATDAANQTGTCWFTVTVADAEAPTISNCPADMTIVASTPVGQPATFTDPTASDNCSGATVSCVPASGTTFPLGTTTVTCTATDAGANTAACSFTVTVVQHDTAGIYVPSTNARFLRNTNTDGAADMSYSYGGAPTLVPIKGDWDDDGVDTPGLYDPATGTFYLKNANAAGVADMTFAFGAPNGGFTPISGDWDGDGYDSVGLYNPTTGTFFLKNTNAAGGADYAFYFGAADGGLIPVAGDWDGDGSDSVGVYNPATSVFFLKNALEAGGADLVFQFGETGGGFLPIAGDWNNDGTDTIGVYNPSTAGFFLTDASATITADYIFVYGPTGATPIVGNWDGY